MQKNMECVVAITVTYNRTSTLERCIRALLNQTRKVDQILIVDNNSSEDEKKKIKLLAADKDTVRVVWLNDNMGGAGGFEAGMREARDRENPDWYWLMDDDAYPREDCLEKLLEAAEKMPDADCLAPLIYGIDLEDYQFYHHKHVNNIIFSNIPVVDQYDQLKDTQSIEANAFVGPLFSKRAVKRVGIADGSLFIYGDDTEYTYRVSRAGSAYLVKDAVIDHQDPPLTANYLQPEAWWKEYYSNRNRYFMVREFQTNLGLRFLAYVYLTAGLVKRITAAALKPKYKGFRRLRMSLCMKTIGDGLGNRRGKTLDPVKYVQYINSHKS